MPQKNIIWTLLKNPQKEKGGLEHNLFSVLIKFYLKVDSEVSRWIHIKKPFCSPSKVDNIPKYKNTFFLYILLNLDWKSDINVACTDNNLWCRSQAHVSLPLSLWGFIEGSKNEDFLIWCGTKMDRFHIFPSTPFFEFWHHFLSLDSMLTFVDPTALVLVLYFRRWYFFWENIWEKIWILLFLWTYELNYYLY